MQNGGPSLMRFSTASLPLREREALLREVFGQAVCNMDMIPLTDTPLVDAALLPLLGLNIMWGENSPHRMSMNRVQNRDGEMFMMSIFASPLQVRHKSEEFDLSGGMALMISTDQRVSAESLSGCQHITLGLPRQTLGPLLPDADSVLMRPIPADREALWLLKNYLRVVQDRGTQWSVEMERAIANHIYDLVALAVGTTRDITEQIRMRGVRAARLEGIKRIVLKHLGNQNLSVTQVAAAQRVTPRYVQMLFESEGTTFSAFVLGERLALAHRMLSDPRHSGRPIGTIALDAGFGDLSYFNRVFRRTYGGTPTDVRNRVMTKLARG
jgi:AraC-like DNA-binding protein